MSTKREHEGGPSQEAIQWYEQNQGKRVTIKSVRHVGVVAGLNRNTQGLYNGGRYPILVKIVESPMPEAIGRTFEYGLEWLVIDKEN